MKKILKIIFLLIIIWIGLEAYNYYEYRVNINNRDAARARGEYIIPMPIFYRPLTVSLFYLFFPSLDSQRGMAYKPVIYLYPNIKEKVQVRLDYKGKIFADYPSYDYSIKGWEVTAYPDGKIINSDGKEYSYLFWEGIPEKQINYDLNTGFVVKGEDTREFLQETLSNMGLTPKEYNEFIVYWYPKMQDNKYNLIHFAYEEYTKTAPLTIIPTPDSVLRVFMVFKPLKKEINITSQEIKSFRRTGFSVVEWGGSELH